jgi:hypothetical protein
MKSTRKKMKVGQMRESKRKQKEKLKVGQMRERELKESSTH